MLSKTKRQKAAGVDNQTPFVGVKITDKLAAGIQKWFASNPESNQSRFLRLAIREKLERDGIKIDQ